MRREKGVAIQPHLFLDYTLKHSFTGKQGKNQYSKGVRWAKEYEI